MDQFEEMFNERFAALNQIPALIGEFSGNSDLALICSQFKQSEKLVLSTWSITAQLSEMETQVGPCMHFIKSLIYMYTIVIGVLLFHLSYRLSKWLPLALLERSKALAQYINLW